MCYLSKQLLTSHLSNSSATPRYLYHCSSAPFANDWPAPQSIHCTVTGDVVAGVHTCDSQCATSDSDFKPQLLQNDFGCLIKVLLLFINYCWVSMHTTADEDVKSLRKKPRRPFIEGLLPETTLPMTDREGNKPSLSSTCWWWKAYRWFDSQHNWWSRLQVREKAPRFYSCKGFCCWRDNTSHDMTRLLLLTSWSGKKPHCDNTSHDSA